MSTALPCICVRGPCPPLQGAVGIAGAKNSAMPILVAAALARARVRVRRVPWIRDIQQLLQILAFLGIGSWRDAQSAVFIEPGTCNATDIPPALSQSFRGSIYSLAVPLALRGSGSIGPIGGDALVGRSLAPHIRAIRGFGMEVEERAGSLRVFSGPPRAAELRVDDKIAGISATCFALLLAASADGESLLHGVSGEPEIRDLANCLSALGASVQLHDGSALVRGPLRSARAELAVPLDSTHIGTLLAATWITRGRTRFPAEAMERISYFLDVMSAGGLNVLPRDGQLLVHGESARGIEVRTGAYPEFPSDLVPPLSAALTQACGDSVIEERVYAHRFDHLSALQLMGAEIDVQGHIAHIRGARRLIGRSVAGSGIRECAALVLAGLSAEGETIITNAGALDRGYEDLVGQLHTLGADIRWINRASAAA